MPDNLTAAEIRQRMAEAERLIGSIPPWTLANVRDRAIIGVMGYIPTSLDAALSLRVRDYSVIGDQPWLRLIENGVERKELVNRRLKQLIEPYLAETGISGEPDTFLFRLILQGQVVSIKPASRRKIVNLIRNLETRSDHLAKFQNEARSLIPYVNGQNMRVLRDRAILSMIAYTNISILDIIAMKTDDFYQKDDAYWVNISGPPPVQATPDLEASVQDYLAYRQAGSKSKRVTFLFGRDEVRSLTPSDVHEIFRRYRNKAKAALASERACP